jgi:hypothetical protein
LSDFAVSEGEQQEYGGCSTCRERGLC